jgi:uncharacterized protein
MTIYNEQTETLKNIIFSNSPWIQNNKELKKPEKFHREAFFCVQKEMQAKHNMAVLIKGPRRVGKTEIQKQLIWNLIKNKKIQPKKVLYLSFDDVQIQSEAPDKRVNMIQKILNTWAELLGYVSYDKIKHEAYCFFDEVQTVQNWDLLIKNYVERNPKVKIVLSGSAAHTIFQKSLKTLMGRVISVNVSTFSFREFLAKNNILELSSIKELQKIQKEFEINLSPQNLYTQTKKLLSSPKYKRIKFQQHIMKFLHQSGFPQIWKINENGKFIFGQAQFMDENYVKKVTLEDLMLLQQIKKPEIYERLLRHLFANPAQEYNQVNISAKLGVPEITLGEAIKLLKQTDLLIFAEKFSNKAEPLQRKNLKIYPIDYGLTFAMTKILPDLQSDNQKGIIAESLVAQTLNRMNGINNLAYLQKKLNGTRREIDFYLRSDIRDCPIEVKYRNHIQTKDFQFMQQIIQEKNLDGGLVVNIDTWSQEEKLYFIPLWAFMLLS